jgi:ethanolamine utilization protein EutN
LILGKVIGTVWSTRKDESLVGAKFLIIRQLDLEYKPKDSTMIAVDSVGAGVGEIVIVAQGSSARQTNQTKNKPVDAVVMAIVDKLDIPVSDDKKESAKK